MPDINYNNGPLLTNPEVTVIFVRQNSVSSDPGNPATPLWEIGATGIPIDTVCTVNTFVHDLMQSAFMDLLSQEYSVPGQYIIGRGSFAGSHFVDLPFTQVDNNLLTVRAFDIEKMILNAIQVGTLEAPNANTIYVCMTAGLNVSEKDGKHVVGVNSGGFHSSLQLHDGTHAVYCVIGGNELDADSLTFKISHEITEAIVNPFQTGWIDAAANPPDEISDVCVPGGDTGYSLDEIEAAGARFHGSLLNKFWSRSQNTCIAPADDSLIKPGAMLYITDSRKQSDTCVTGIVEGEEINFFVQGMLDGANIAITDITWKTSGNAPIENTAGNRMTLVAPAAGVTFTVSVSATSVDWGCNLNFSKDFVAISNLTLGVQELFCKARHEILKYWKFINPPTGNPVRDFNSRPITEIELRAFQSLGKTFAKIAEAGEKLRNEI